MTKKKYWNEIISNNLSYEEARKNIEEFHPYYMTRPEWQGVHFYDKNGKYCILFKDGHIEKDMEDKVWNKDSNDWMIVTITEEAVQILKKNNLI